MQEVLATVDRVGRQTQLCCWAGESGVGKDLIARAIHEKVAPSWGTVYQNQQHRNSGKSSGERTVWI